MGSKGSSAPAPDPRLTDAQIRSMGYQDTAIQRMLAQSEEMLPLQKAQLQFGLDSARTAYDQSQDDRDWMLTRRSQLAGLQDRLTKDAESYNEGDRVSQLLGQANVDVDNAFAAARGQGMRAQMGYGVTPGSGRAMAMANQLDTNQALARATASNKVREAARQEGFALTDRAVNALAGYPAMGMSATGAGAGFGSMGLNLANMGLSGMNSGFGAAGGMAGSMGQNATGMFGAQANYKNSQDQIAGQSAGSTMGGLGSLVGAGASLYKSGALTALGGMFSDPRLKENVERVGTHAATNLGLYEFNYIAQPNRRFRGVMADEVVQKYPGAVGRDSRGYMTVNYGMLGVPFEEIANG